MGSMSAGFIGLPELKTPGKLDTALDRSNGDAGCEGSSLIDQRQYQPWFLPGNCFLPSPSAG